ncbi:MAG: type II secretion system protein GspG [Candidatus Riflebacteria bacterium]|nr:type II secretion system protein GspG [Candidatus Riflebacteria bacterium]
MQKILRHETAGFTLMEIMVVIIVIAVLASVAGPMIGSITDQGKASATKAQMQNIKTALVNFNNDLGKFPFLGLNASDKDQYGTSAENSVLGTNVSSNVLVSNSVTGAGYSNLGIQTATYAKRWKGPYMDSQPEDFMLDAWESKIHYEYYGNMLWLHSYGPDGQSDSSNFFTNPPPNPYNGDDIFMSISRVKF